MVVILDNYDSFTYNLAAYVQQCGAAVTVLRNDVATVAGVASLNPKALLISPGPGLPLQAGNTPAIYTVFAQQLPILGVCLGHQLMGQLAGAKLVQAILPVHGKTSTIVHDGQGIFVGLPKRMQAMRYHSWVLAPESLPAEWEAAAYAESTDDATSELMAIRHRRLPLHGIQFHPESVGTPDGLALVKNWVQSFS